MDACDATRGTVEDGSGFGMEGFGPAVVVGDCAGEGDFRESRGVIFSSSGSDLICAGATLPFMSRCDRVDEKSETDGVCDDEAMER